MAQDDRERPAMSNRLLQWAMKWQVPAAALDELMKMEDVDATDHADVSETAIVRACRLEADRLGGVLWRNNSGATFDQNGRMIRYGLGNDSKKLSRDYKSSDLVGLAPGGRFMAVECKAKGWKGVRTEREHAQANFGRHVVKLGGLFTFATAPEHIQEMMTK
jgi:hypothetical protein